MPLDPTKSVIRPCCSNLICQGCVYENYKSNKNDLVKVLSCPFCREVASEQDHKRMMKRVKANDPVALRYTGDKCYDEVDYDTAFEYFSKAAELGDIDSHYSLGNMYYEGEGVEEDMEKAVYHYEKAAIGGNPYARHNLAIIEEWNGNIERAVKHLIIAANLGHDKAMKELWKHYSAGHITKEELETTLRTHQAAIDAMKSSDRDAGEIALKELGCID
jgi:TPR repeat protein